MRILVTGAAGFAGGHIARGLARAGCRVLAATRGAPVLPPAEPAAAARFSEIVVRLDEPGALPACEAIVHAAATSAWTGISVDRLVTDNVVATQSLVRHALAVRAGLFVFCSSVSAFGDIAGDVLTEEHRAVSPGPYGTTKLLCEQMLADVAAALPSLAIRLPAVVGNGSRRNWPSETRRKLEAGEPLAYFNPGARYNNVLHEADLCRLVEHAIRQPVRGHHMVLAASAGEMRIAEAVELMRRATGSRSVVTCREEARPSFTIDSTLAQQLLGWRPMDVRDALAAYLAAGA